jgi:hypothetical protein
LGVPAVVGGIIFIVIVGRGAVEEFSRIMGALSWWGQLLVCVLLVLFYFLVRITWDVKKTSK